MPDMMAKVTNFIRAYHEKYGRKPDYIELSTSEMQDIIDSWPTFYPNANPETITKLYNIPVRKVD